MDANTHDGRGPAPNRRNSGSSGAKNLDCESAALLRASIRPLFEQSASWLGLMDRLRDRGYRLAFREGSLCITDRESESRICGLNFLGLNMRDLVDRMGRLTVLPRPGNRADGDILRHPPGSQSTH